METRNLDKGVENWILTSLATEGLNLVQAKAKCSTILAAATARATAKIAETSANPENSRWSAQIVYMHALKAAVDDITAWAKTQ